MPQGRARTPPGSSDTHSSSSRASELPRGAGGMLTAARCGLCSPGVAYPTVAAPGTAMTAVTIGTPMRTWTTCVILLALPNTAHARIAVNDDTWWLIPIHFAGAWVAFNMARKKNRPMWFWGYASFALGWLAVLILLAIPAYKESGGGS
jgi:hypothetical protein